MKRARWAALSAAALLALAACGPAADAGGNTPSGAVVVFAAASLTESFERIGADFESANPGVEVVFGFGGSSSLAAQINEGAPADVFASAAPANMDAVVEAGDAVDPAVFARNQLVIAVPAGNPDGIEDLADLAASDRKVAVCDTAVPCGAAAAAALAAAGVDLVPATYETDVKSALGKLTLGEVDAALVYRTDARASSQVDGIEFPESAEAVNDYPIAALTDAPNPDLAAAFVDYVRSDAGRAVLLDAGFLAP